MPANENDQIKDPHKFTVNPGPWTEFFLNGPKVSEDFFSEQSKAPTDLED